MRTIEKPAAGVRTDGYRVLPWTAGDFDVLLLDGDAVVHRLSAAPDKALAFVERLRERLLRDGAAPLGEIVDAYRR